MTYDWRLRSTSYRQTVAPTAYPVTVSEAKQHLRVDHDDEDYRIQRLIASATDVAEQYLKAPLMTQTWVQQMSAFRYRYVELEVYPVQSITSVTYIDPNDVEQTLSTDVYDLDIGQNPSFLYLKHDQSWPSVRGVHNDVTITMVCGWTTTPPAVIEAIMLMIGDGYEHREETVLGTIVAKRGAVASLLNKYRNPKL